MLALLATAKWAGAFLAVVMLAVLSYRGLLPGSTYDLNVVMPGADGLYPGSDVLIAGSKAGTVTGITLHGNGVLVGISLDPAHSPVHSDSTLTLRPKSLLGEKYLDLNPGATGGSLRPGATLGASHVKVATDLQDVINTFDQPTREKLQTVLLELGGGVAGRGPDTNETLRYGTQDMADLAQVANTLQQRDAELEKVIRALDTVTAELAQSDRRAQLGELIANSDRLIKNLANQDAELKRALSQTNAALSRTDTALSGTQGSLDSIFQNLPSLVHRTDLLMGDLSSASDAALATAGAQHRSIHETALVFGGYDAAGYATRISVLAGASSAAGGVAPGPGGTLPPLGSVPAGPGSSDADIYRFLIEGPR